MSPWHSLAAESVVYVLKSKTLPKISFIPQLKLYMCRLVKHTGGLLHFAQAQCPCLWLLSKFMDFPVYNLLFWSIFVLL